MKMIKTVILIWSLLLFSTSATYADSWGDKRNSDYTLTQDSKNIDSLVIEFYKDIYSSHKEYANEVIYNDSIFNTSAKRLPDSVYIKRLEMLNSVINLPYNSIIRNYISSYTSSRGHLDKILGRAEYYLPIFEEELMRQGMPTELKILPIIESALNPTAMSHAGAAGLWQFMYATGRHYGLMLNSFVDERLDPIKSTQAACLFLKDLYKIYGDWTLALAAYNCGPGNVNKALRRVPNAESYWDIYYYLPRETRGYVPAFIGATYAYTYHKAHGIEIESLAHPVITDTLRINGRMLHFKQISTTIDVSENILRALNPSYVKDILPARNQEFTLVLPRESISDFIENESDIYDKESKYLKEFENAKVIDLKTNRYIIHRVKQGEILGTISRKYRVSVANLKRWNNIKNERSIQVGQRLKIFR